MTRGGGSEPNDLGRVDTAVLGDRRGPAVAVPEAPGTASGPGAATRPRLAWRAGGAPILDDDQRRDRLAPGGRACGGDRASVLVDHQPRHLRRPVLHDHA